MKGKAIGASKTKWAAEMGTFAEYPPPKDGKYEIGITKSKKKDVIVEKYVGNLKGINGIHLALCCGGISSQTEVSIASIFVQTVTTAAWIVFFAMVGWLLFLVGPDPVFAAEGKDIFANSCASCHGKTGKGDGVAAAALKPKPTDLTNKAAMAKLKDDYLVEIISKGGTAVGKSPLMPAFGTSLKGADIKNIILYLRSLAK